MKQGIIALLLLTMTLSLSACGHSVNDKDNKVNQIEAEESNEIAFDRQAKGNEDDVEFTQSTSTKDISKEIDINHEQIEKYEQEFVANSSYNPIFEQRCFYVDGIKVHLPNTVRDIEKLFNTKFVTAKPYTGPGPSGFALIDGNNMGITLQVYRTNTTGVDEETLLEMLLDAPIFAITYYESHDTFGIDGNNYIQLLSAYNVSFEDVDEFINDYGYTKYYKNADFVVCYYTPEELYVYHEFLKGTMPVSVNCNGYIAFDTVHEGEDWYQMDFGNEDYDATCEFALDNTFPHYGHYDLYVKDTYGDVYAYAYDTLSKTIIQLNDISSLVSTKSYEELKDTFAYLIKIEHLSQTADI